MRGCWYVLQRASAHGAASEERRREAARGCERRRLGAGAACKHRQLLGARAWTRSRDYSRTATWTRHFPPPTDTGKSIARSQNAQICAVARREPCDTVTPAARLNVRADWVALQACVAAQCAHDRAARRCRAPTARRKPRRSDAQT